MKDEDRLVGQCGRNTMQPNGSRIQGTVPADTDVRRPWILIAFFTGILTVGCAARLGNPPEEALFVQPAAGGLVVGCVIMEDQWARIVDTPLHVTIAHESSTGNDIQLATLETDSQGYFTLTGALPGNYWLFRVRQPELPVHLQADNRGWFDQYGWFRQYSPDVYPPFVPPTAGELVPGGVLDLGYLILRWTNPVEDYQFEVLDSVRVFSDEGTIMIRPSVPEHLLTRYRGSVWEDQLRAHIKGKH